MYEHIDLLKEMVQKGYVSVQRHPRFDYYIYNYTNMAQFDRMWNPATLQARGLILNGRGEIVARPFKKFFNIQEHSSEEIPWGEDAIVLEKVDGSLGISYVGEDGLVYLATRGSFTSEQAIHGTSIIRTNPHACQLISKSYDLTHLFEIVYPENRIVVDYKGFDGLVYLGSVEKETSSVSITRPKLIDWFLNCNSIRIAETYPVSNIADLKNNVVENFEGYVVRFEPSGFMMKVKLDEYVRLHRIMTCVSNVSIWESMMNGDSLESMLTNVPDEFYDWIKGIIASLQHRFNEVESSSKMFYEELKEMERHEIAYALLHAGDARKKEVANIVFSMLDKKEYSQKIWKMIRPEYQRPFYQRSQEDA